MLGDAIFIYISAVDSVKIKDILASNNLQWTDFMREPECSQKILAHLIGTGELDKYMRT